MTTIPIIMDNKVAGVYAVVKDIEDAKAYQNRIHHLAYHDELTGLPNRRYFMNELAARAAEALTGFAVIYVDLDRFKKVNDLFGHSFGDQLITDAASKLRQLLPKSSILARLGGDEFVILADGTADKMLLQPLLRKIVGLFGQPLLVMGQEVILSASLGVAFFPKDGTEPDELMKKADLAMYESKRNGAQHFHFYENTMKAADLADILLENDLRRALERGEMEAYYQPKVDHSTSAVIGGEALLRWRHPRLGLVSPARFIPVAEETGVIVELERWIMEEACRQNKRWQEEGLPAIPISVNLSPSHLSQSTIITTVTEALGKSGLEARYLELEVTESMMMHNEERSIQRLHQFKLLGLSISMDDFGTGYSSLSYLTKLPIDILKIDQSFVRQLETGSRAIVETIISMARLLSLQVIAEGVETLEQADLLASLGCVQVQGYCYSPPVPAAEFRQLLEQQSLPPSAGFQSSCL
ncbi:EAL domain-containing protein [Paenibacillus sp. CC-CFT747]|nr:EAL domain-containing protein [Paenibacillus sp. CC-CFT747]